MSREHSRRAGAGASRLGALALVLASLVAPARGHAQIEALESELAEIAAARPGRPHLFDGFFAREMDNGCEYRVGVNGVVRSVPVQRRDGTTEVRYSPRVYVGSEVACPDGRRERLSRREVRGERLTVTQFEARLERATRLTARHDGRSCQYRPEIRYRGTRAVVPFVTYTCARGTGGGPRDTGMLR